MADAWGGSWGSAWGVSWGTRRAAVTPDRGFEEYFINLERERTLRLKEDEEVMRIAEFAEIARIERIKKLLN